MRSGDTLIFAPTYNERGAIESLLDALLALPHRCDLLVVDDRSTDGTAEVLRSRAAVDARLRVIERPGKLGIGSAHSLAWMEARARGYARIVTLDADLSHDPADVPRLLDALDRGADVAIGSRSAPGGRLDYRGWRLFLSRNANRLARLLLRLPMTEYTTSLRAARLDRVPQGLVEAIDNEGYGFFLTSAVRFARAGLKVVEVPIHFRDRTAGASKIPRFEVVRGVLNLAGLAMFRRSSVPAVDLAGTCPQCDRPYLIRRPSGEQRCLGCRFKV
jgi:dolichol-phosphate mannosyltransferase